MPSSKHSVVCRQRSQMEQSRAVSAQLQPHASMYSVQPQHGQKSMKVSKVEGLQQHAWLQIEEQRDATQYWHPSPTASTQSQNLQNKQAKRKDAHRSRKQENIIYFYKNKIDDGWYSLSIICINTPSIVNLVEYRWPSLSKFKRLLLICTSPK